MEQTISLCMITKNEEKYIEQCLNSVKDIVDEIIIGDTGSTDKTIQIAKNFAPKAKVFEFKWIDDFSAARNEGLKHAAKEWILVLDADEILDESSAKEIRGLIEANDYDAYLMPQKNYTDKRGISGFIPSANLQESKGYAGFYVSLICRLFRNKMGYKFTGIVHELVEPSIRESNGRLAACNIAIHHFGNASPEIEKRKKQYYLQLSKTKARQNPSASSYYELGLLSKENYNVLEAEESFKKVLSYNPEHSRALYELGIIKEKNNELDEAIEYFSKSVKSKEEGETLFSLGTCYLKKGMLKQAYTSFIKSLIYNPNKYALYNNLGVIHEKNGSFDEALKVLEIAIKLNPQNAVGFYNMAIVYEKIGNKEKSLECYEKALSLGHKNKDALGKKIQELKNSIDNSVKYGYSFKVGG